MCVGGGGGIVYFLLLPAVDLGSAVGGSAEEKFSASDRDRGAGSRLPSAGGGEGMRRRRRIRIRSPSAMVTISTSSGTRGGVRGNFGVHELKLPPLLRSLRRRKRFPGGRSHGFPQHCRYNQQGRIPPLDGGRVRQTSVSLRGRQIPDPIGGEAHCRLHEELHPRLKSNS